MSSLFCWTGSRASELSEEELQRARMFESAFTYNTERNYNNNYSNWTRGNNTTHYHDDDRRLDDLKPTSVIELIFVALSFVLFVCTLPFSLIFSLKFVGDFERLVVLRLGKAQRVRGPGTVLVFPCIDKTAKVDIRVISYDLPNIHIITTDKGIVEFSASVFSQVIDPLTSYCNILDKDATIKNLAYTASYKHLMDQ
uniref:PHB domain-containing protein n=1 Tax=Panagrellus redivivus TaxID=6233 RepID=A0A7E4ZZQ3_PANRE